ncbi:MAG TPA: class I SAM-dependent methyltransferase family protein [Chthoniobacter sp.]|jgi:hypothetical protein
MNAAVVTPSNFTRRTVDLPAKFRREGLFALIPLYHLLRLSDLAREGIEHSGSYRFADHVYRNEASGTGRLGRWLDRRLLNLAATRAMRGRYERSHEAMERAFDAHLAGGQPAPFRLLTVPCGIPRDVREFAGQMAGEDRTELSGIEYCGIDLDPVVVEAAAAFLADGPLPVRRIIQGNALDAAAYLPGGYHFIASTGLGEFLSDADLGAFYDNVFSALAPGGTFFTSATSYDRKSDFLLRSFELNSYYRTRADVGRLLGGRDWASMEFESHGSGLQTFVRAVKRDVTESSCGGSVAPQGLGANGGG